MNRKLINKILDELQAEEPNLSYIRGILETVLEGLPEDKGLSVAMGIPPYVQPLNVPITVGSPTPNNVIATGVEALELGVKAKMASLQKAEIQ